VSLCPTRIIYYDSAFSWKGKRGGCKEEEERRGTLIPCKKLFALDDSGSREFVPPRENPNKRNASRGTETKRRSSEVENNQRGKEIPRNSSAECLMARAEHRIIIAVHKAMMRAVTRRNLPLDRRNSITREFCWLLAVSLSGRVLVKMRRLTEPSPRAAARVR